jgi:beta-glucoside PTS system EIICBA component
LPGPLTIVNGISSEVPSSIWGILIGTAIAIVLPIVLIQIFGFGENTAKQVAAGESVPEDDVDYQNEEPIATPLRGQIVPLSEVTDEVFSSGAMGQGVAIEPIDNKLYAPFDGTVVMIALTKHAIGLRSNSGVEMLVHIGLDTVKLDGKPFTVHVEDGAKIQKGDLLITFDKEAIQKEGIKITTPLIITNTHSYKEIIVENILDGIVGEKLLTVVK